MPSLLFEADAVHRFRSRACPTRGSAQRQTFMPTLRSSSRLTAAVAFLITALVTVGIWVVLLFVPNPNLVFARYAFSSKNEYRWFFVIFTVSGVLSLFLGIVVAITRRRAVLQFALVACVVQAVLLLLSGAFLLAPFAAAPLWWLYKAQHEV